MKTFQCSECANEFQSQRRRPRCPDCSHSRWVTQMKTGKERRNKERLESGMCLDCGKEVRIGESKWCEYHWIMRLVRNRFSLKGESAQKLSAILLEKLHKQNFICYYTGLPLTVGLNASIEHLLPESNNPESSHDPNNLVWVRIEVNKMRSNLSFNDFLFFCSACLKSETLRTLASVEILQPNQSVIQ